MTICIFLGVFPGYLYSILPHPVDYAPYTGAHIIDQLQLLFFSALAVTLLMLSGIYPAEIRATNLDADWFYRKGARAFMWAVNNPMARFGAWINRVAFDAIPGSLSWFSKNPLSAVKIGADTLLLRFSKKDRRTGIERRLKAEKQAFPGEIVKNWPIGQSVLWATLFLLVYLLIY